MTNNDFAVLTVVCTQRVAFITDSLGNKWARDVQQGSDFVDDIAYWGNVWSTTTSGGSNSITITMLQAGTCQGSVQQFNTDSKFYYIDSSTQPWFTFSRPTDDGDFGGADWIWSNRVNVAQNGLIVSFFFMNQDYNGCVGNCGNTLQYQKFLSPMQGNTCNAGTSFSCRFASAWNFIADGLDNNLVVYDNNLASSALPNGGTVSCTNGSLKCPISPASPQRRATALLLTAVYIPEAQGQILVTENQGVDTSGGISTSVAVPCSNRVCGYALVVPFSGDVSKINIYLAQGTSTKFWIVLYTGDGNVPTGFTLQQSVTLDDGATNGLVTVPLTTTSVTLGQTMFIGVWTPDTTLFLATSPGGSPKELWKSQLALAAAQTPASVLPTMADVGLSSAIMFIDLTGYKQINTYVPTPSPIVVAPITTTAYPVQNTVFFLLFALVPVLILTYFAKLPGMATGLTLGVIFGNAVGFLPFYFVLMLFLTLILLIYLMIRGGSSWSNIR